MQRSDNFVLYLRPNLLGHARLGVVVAKRLAPRAVTRNAIKRLVREVFRKSPLGSFDCIVRLSRSPVRRESSAAPRALRVVLSAELRGLFSAIVARHA